MHTYGRFFIIIVRSPVAELDSPGNQMFNFREVVYAFQVPSKKKGKTEDLQFCFTSAGLESSTSVSQQESCLDISQ